MQGWVRTCSHGKGSSGKEGRGKTSEAREAATAVELTATAQVGGTAEVRQRKRSALTSHTHNQVQSQTPSPPLPKRTDSDAARNAASELRAMPYPYPCNAKPNRHPCFPDLLASPSHRVTSVNHAQERRKGTVDTMPKHNASQPLAATRSSGPRGRGVQAHLWHGGCGRGTWAKRRLNAEAA